MRSHSIWGAIAAVLIGLPALPALPATAATASGGGNVMRAGANSVIVPAVIAVNSKSAIGLDLTKDNKDPFCNGKGSGRCKPGWASTASWAYFAKATTFALKLKGHASCDSTQPKAAQVTPVQPPASIQIGYQVGFDLNCGKKGKPDYSGVVAQLFVMDSARLHSYAAPPGGGFQGTDHLVVALHDKAKVNGVTCVTGKALDAVSFLLKLKDYTDVIGDITSGEFAKKLAEIAAEDFQELATKPVSGTTSCKAQRIFDQAAAVIHAEAIAAKHNADPLHFFDELELKGKTTSSLSTTQPRSPERRACRSRSST
ncbi:MAG TPA: hypothetical protein VGM14_03440 [Streptosporangiaceae bacterium]